MPNVVLIAQCNQSTAAGMNGLFKVEDGTLALGIPMDVHGKRGLRGKVHQQFHTVVRRTIVEDVDFIRQPGLREDAFQLCWKETGAIVGAKSDGDAFGAGLVSAHAASLLSRTEAKFNTPWRSPALRTNRQAITMVSTAQSIARIGCNDASRGAAWLTTSSAAEGSSTKAGRRMLIAASRSRSKRNRSWVRGMLCQKWRMTPRMAPAKVPQATP